MSNERPRKSPKPVPVAKVVALPPGSKRNKVERQPPAKRKRFPWVAAIALSVTAMGVAAIVYFSGRVPSAAEANVAQGTGDAQSETNFAPPAEPAGDEAAPPSAAATPSDVAKTPPTTLTSAPPTAQTGEPAETADAGSLDVSLLKALEPEKIGETARFGAPSIGVECLVVSPDEKTLATGHADGTIHLWDLESKQPLRQFTGHSDGVHCLAFAPDGARLVSGSTDGTLRVWDTVSGSEFQRLTGHKGTIAAIAISPDGRIAYSIAEATLKQWDLATGKAIRSLEGTADFTALALDPGGETVLVGTWDGSIAVWDGRGPTWTNPPAPPAADGLSEVAFVGGAPPTGGPIQKHSAPIAYLRIDGDGHVVSADESGETITWNLATGDELGRLAAAGSVLGHLPGANGTTVFAGDGAGAIQFYDPETSGVTHRLVGHEGRVSALALIASRKQAITAGRDDTLRLWTLPVVGE